eukprot:GILJ01004013.1.p1 GENE.GILJ01004013.1~~GILJ01004013.1.p1  ORF type:complete len:201 (+),score=35.34 GILJ01004013.1:36-605(+)
MSDKLLQEFVSRLQKTKHLLTATTTQCEQLRRETLTLEKQLVEAEDQRARLEEMEEQLKIRFLESKVRYEDEYALKFTETKDLTETRKRRNDLVKQREGAEQEFAKALGDLRQRQDEHANLEHVARTLSEKLDAVAQERKQYEAWWTEQHNLSERFSSDLQTMRNDEASMRSLIVNSIDRSQLMSDHEI